MRARLCLELIGPAVILILLPPFHHTFGEEVEHKWGSVTGRFVLQGEDRDNRVLSQWTDERGALAGAYVWVISPIERTHSSYLTKRKTIAVNVSEIADRPQVIAIESDWSLSVTNDDKEALTLTIGGLKLPELHQFELNPSQSKEIVLSSGTLYPYPAIAATADMTFGYRFYICVRGHPYYDVTGADGRFQLRNLPTGWHQIQAWHPTHHFRIVQQWKHSRRWVYIEETTVTDLGDVEIRLPR